MRYTWIDPYLMGKRGVTKDLQKDWNWIRYHIGGKMFAAVLLDHNDQPYYINLKLEPSEGELMRAQYADIIPGYYSDKRCWNSVKADGEVPDEVLKALLDRSCALVLEGLPKARQREALSLTVCGTDCTACPLHGSTCQGCNEAKGKVFHAPAGQPCPIYGCCVNKQRRASCAGCGDVPCTIWLNTKDPAMSDEQFAENTRQRVARLRDGWHCR